MDLKGAKIRNIYRLCTNIHKEEASPLRINIPHYQRPYRWGEEKIELLIRDFFENYNKFNDRNSLDDSKEQKKYFAGSIVTVKKGNDNKYHDLIDGQQRITTVFLVNYIKFLLLRSYISELIYQGDELNIKEAFNNMIKAASNLYKNGKKEIKKIKRDIVSKMGEVDDDNEQGYKNLSKCYKRGVGLTIKNLDDPDYSEDYKEELEEFLDNKTFCLKYSRESFNKKLKESLAHIRIELTSKSGPSLEIIDENDIKKDNTIEQYIDAMETIFNSFEDLLEDVDLTPLEKVEEITKNKIDSFLEYLNFCLIQTGNTNDAYTLFEVLNDRALELDDLDLIKNMFYKEYCQQNLSKDEKVIDKNIETLEELWGDEIFSQNTPEWKKKLVSFLGTVFLTGDTTVSHNAKEKYRESIKKYLEVQYSDEGKNKNYNFKDIKCEFEIFQVIKLIINEYDIPYQKKGMASLKAENNPNVSITYKTLHLLNALKYFGIMSPLINIILKIYIRDYGNEFDIKEFETYLVELKNDKNHKKDQFDKIHNCAYDLWRLAMLSKNYKLPREFAKRTVKNINYNNFEKDVNINMDQFRKAKKQFNKWITRWYKGSKDDFRIKILFLNLIKSKKENDKISYTNSQDIFTNIENLELDHFEPEDPDEANQEKYFVPENIGDDRDNYINQLGNFMLLEKDKNISLGNKPADRSFGYYREMGLGDHWIVKEMNEVLEENSKQIRNVRVPTKEFFNKRKKKLQRYFFTIIQKNLKEDEVKIKTL